MTSAVRPHLLADPAAVRFDRWSIESENGWEELPPTLADWDYHTNLRLRGEIDVDLSLLRTSTALTATTPLRVSVSWRSRDGRIGSTALLAPVEDDGQHVLDVVLPGRRLGPEIDLAVRIVLADRNRDPLPGAPRLAGSAIWEHVTRLGLVGDGARFPVMVIDFADSRLDPDASWVLDLPTDLGSPVLGRLALLINSRDSQLVNAAAGRGRQSASVLDQLFEQVGVQLLDHAVAHATELLDDEWEPGTLGATLMALAARSEGGLSELVQLREQRPSAYRARLVGEARRNGVGRLPA